MRTSLALLLTLMACGEPSVAPQPQTIPTPQAKAPAPAPVAEAPTPAPTAVAPKAEAFRQGKVLEVLPVDERYTYARMDACGTEAWVAGPAAELKVGQTVEMKGGMALTDFKSTKLDRTFPQLLMVNAWRPSDTEMDCSAPTPPPAPAPVAAPADGPPNENMEFGVAAEVTVGAGYTFVQLNYCGKSTWYAGPETPVKKGDSVGVAKAMVMKDFFAKSLNRKFDEIRFVQEFKKAKALPPCK